MRGDSDTVDRISRSAFDAVLFDLDGVITDTAKVHEAAWGELFNGFLAEQDSTGDGLLSPFTSDDYLRYVDGKPRYEGVRSFLESRGFDLPEGTPADSPDASTVCGLGNRKNALFNEVIARDGVPVIESAVRFLKTLRDRGFKTAVVSSSRNCAAVLEAARLLDAFDARVDGEVAAELGLPGKPRPDTFLEAARELGVAPERAVVVEDAISGVEAGRSGGFGLVIGVDRGAGRAALEAGGADLVVARLVEVPIDDGSPIDTQALPSALDRSGEIAEALRGRTLALFLDYDGTLTPIVERPELAVLSEETRAVLDALAARCVVAVISGRDLDNLRELVGVESAYYAGSHGFCIAGPQGWAQTSEHGVEFLPILDAAERELRAEIEAIPGALVERKYLSIATHYRLVDPARAPEVESIVDAVHARHRSLRKTSGKKVFELQPDIDWDKGQAVLWLLQALQLDRPDVLPIFVGDDLTDEDAFRVLRDRGLGIVVRDAARPTAARYALDDTDQVREALGIILAGLEGRRDE